jgi:hypothetical protein
MGWSTHVSISNPYIVCDGVISTGRAEGGVGAVPSVMVMVLGYTTIHYSVHAITDDGQNVLAKTKLENCVTSERNSTSTAVFQYQVV